MIDDKWKVIPYYYFRNYGGLLFLLKCNYNVKLLKTGLPLFYRELLQYFQDLKNTAKKFESFNSDGMANSFFGITIQ